MARDEVSIQPDAARPTDTTDLPSPLQLPPLQLPPLAGMGATESRPWGKLNDDAGRYRDSDDGTRQDGLELRQSVSASDGGGISRGDTGRSLGAATTEYKVYKRRFFGVAQLCLLNIVVSWDWLTFAPVSASSASYFGTDENAINWLSIAFFFAFVPAAPAVIYTLHRGPKTAIMVCAGLVLFGNWIRYGGARANNFGAVMFGQILTGLAQPFVLAAPTRYSDMWFTSRGRVAATALMSLSNPLGAALGQLIVPMWVTGPQDVPNAVLYIAIISTLSALPSFFIAASPPTPAAPSSETPKTSLRATVHALTSCLEFWLVAIPFAVFVGLFNSISSLLPQIMTPYGYTVDEAGIAGAVLIVVGLVASAISSPIIDRTKLFVPAIKIAVPIIALAYLALIFMPATRDRGGLAGPYVVLAILGAASFSLLPVAVELSVEFTHPVSPEVTSTLAWSLGQLMGGCILLISGAVRAGPGASPPMNMNQALIFHAVVALLAMPLPLGLGLFGRHKMLELKRIKSDRASLTTHVGPA